MSSTTHQAVVDNGPDPEENPAEPMEVDKEPVIKKSRRIAAMKGAKADALARRQEQEKLAGVPRVRHRYKKKPAKKDKDTKGGVKKVAPKKIKKPASQKAKIAPSTSGTSSGQSSSTHSGGSPGSDAAMPDTTTAAPVKKEKKSNTGHRKAARSTNQVSINAVGNGNRRHTREVSIETEAPVLVAQQPIIENGDEIPEPDSTTGGDLFADLPDLVPFDQVEPINLDDDESDCEIVFSGIPEVPAKRWFSATTDAGKQVLEFMMNNFYDGDMPVAKTVEEALDCINVVRKVERVRLDSSAVNCAWEVFYQMQSRFCPLMVYDQIRNWTLSMRDFMKKRNTEMMEYVFHNEKTKKAQIWKVKQELENADSSKFTTEAAGTMKNYIKVSRYSNDVLPPVPKTEREAYQCLVLEFEHEWHKPGRPFLNLLEMYNSNPKGSWMSMYKILRPWLVEEKKFNDKRFDQVGELNLKIRNKIKETGGDTNEDGTLRILEGPENYIIPFAPENWGLFRKRMLNNYFFTDKVGQHRL